MAAIEASIEVAIANSEGRGDGHLETCDNHHNHDHRHFHNDHHLNVESKGFSSFRVPERAILTKEDLARWLESETMAEFMGFVEELNSVVKNKKLSDPVPISKACETILSALDEVEGWVSEIPAVTSTASRFGNPAFRDWFDKLESACSDLTARLVADTDATREVSTYLLHSF
ncbi:Serine/threonine-protein phosphatase 2A activator, partial [Cladochytrium tenue]